MQRSMLTTFFYNLNELHNFQKKKYDYISKLLLQLRHEDVSVLFDLI